jgi:hypothetical protein
MLNHSTTMFDSGVSEMRKNLETQPGLCSSDWHDQGRPYRTANPDGGPGPWFLRSGIALM